MNPLTRLLVAVERIADGIGRYADNEAEMVAMWKARDLRAEEHRQEDRSFLAANIAEHKAGNDDALRAEERIVASLKEAADSIGGRLTELEDSYRGLSAELGTLLEERRAKKVPR